MNALRRTTRRSRSATDIPPGEFCREEMYGGAGYLLRGLAPLCTACAWNCKSTGNTCGSF